MVIKHCWGMFPQLRFVLMHYCRGIDSPGGSFGPIPLQ